VKTLPWLTDALPAGEPPLLLAPMAGFTDAPTRLIARQHGAATTYTEMVNALGIARRDPPSLQLLETLPGEAPVVAHLYGTDPEAFAAAAEIVTALDRFVAIDLNCGCPAPRVTQSGAGAALLENPSQIGRIIAAIRCHTHLPVTLKTRTGPDAERVTIDEVVRIAADAGAAAITIHGRHRLQGHSGSVNYEAIERVVATGLLPVIGNGGIRDQATAARMQATGVAALMPGWAAVGNPWLFRHEADPPVATIAGTLRQHLDLAQTFKQHLQSRYPHTTSGPDVEQSLVLDFRTHFFRYLNGMRGVTTLRGSLSQLHSLAAIRQAVEEVLANETSFRARVGRL